MPCVAGWWPPGHIAIEIGDSANRAACLSVPKNALVDRQDERWADLDLKLLRPSDCASSLPSPKVRVEPWHAARAPQPSLTSPASDSDFPDYLRFPSGMGASGTEMFVPRDSSSGLRTVTCAIGSDKCWAVARDGQLLAKWPTSRKRLAMGLDQDWACARAALQAARID
jgi:hypothetical protein